LWGYCFSTNKLVVSPFVFVHPFKENVKKIDKSFFFKRKLIFIGLQIPNNLIADVNYVIWLTLFPKFLLVLFSNEKFEVIQEADNYLALLAVFRKNSKKMRSHILTSIMAVTLFKKLVIDNCLTQKGFFQFLQAIKVQ